MNILDKIVSDKRKEIDYKKRLIRSKALEHMALFDRKPFPLSTNLRRAQTGIIAEFKRRSPSKSIINQEANVWEVAQGYEMAQVAGMSVLTDGKYFGGSIDDLMVARSACSLPILRKDFIIDEYQILEAKAYGADVVLLIAAVLSRHEIITFASLAKSLDLEILLEVHNIEELNTSIMPNIDMIGVNNRNLKTFEVSLETSKELSDKIPTEFVKISESGISSIEAIKELKPYGFEGFLIGENFMKSQHPGDSALQFIKTVNS